MNSKKHTRYLEKILTQKEIKGLNKQLRELKVNIKLPKYTSIALDVPNEPFIYYDDFEDIIYEIYLDPSCWSSLIIKEVIIRR